MQMRNLALALVLALAGCHHDSNQTTAPRGAAPQPDFAGRTQARTPRAMAARVPASPGTTKIWPTGWVFFESDSEALSPAAQQDLDASVDWLRAHPAERIVIEGHTDASGAADYNLELSFRRGVVVADYLAAHGVARARIDIEPQGERGASRAVRSGDRRVIIFAALPKK
jgi:peptidoglycan-associated lipoprotein